MNAHQLRDRKKQLQAQLKAADEIGDYDSAQAICGSLQLIYRQLELARLTEVENNHLN